MGLGDGGSGVFCIACRFSNENSLATNQLSVFAFIEKKRRSMIHAEHVPQVAMGSQNQQANMVHSRPRLVDKLLRQTFALVHTHPVGVGMILCEACHSTVLHIVGICAKALSQACSLEQHKNVADSHTSLAHLEDVGRQLVLDGSTLALGSFMAGLL